VAPPLKSLPGPPSHSRPTFYQLIATRMREADYIKVDETPVRCLEPGAGKAASG
jgi:hypothetical protein